MIDDDSKSTPPAAGSTSASSTSTDADGTNEHTSTGPTPPTPGLAATTAKPGEGATTTIGGGDRDADLAAANEHIEVAGDPDGVVTNRPDGGGTLQREPTPEELPSDVKVTPLAEQVNPANAQSVGAAPQPESIAGIDQPKEGEKNVQSDMSDPTKLLPEDSEQHEDAERAAEDAARDADRGRY